MKPQFAFTLLLLISFLFENAVQAQVPSNPNQHFNEPHADYQSKLDFYKQRIENRPYDLRWVYSSDFPKIEKYNPIEQTQLSSTLSGKSHALSMVGKKKVNLRGGEARLDSTYILSPGGVDPYEKIYYTYDEQDRLTLAFITYGSWPGVQILYEYDNSNRLQTEIHQFYNGQGWDDDMKLDYSYTTTFLQADTITRSSPDWQTGDWRVNQKNIFDLDGQGLPEIEYQFWVNSEGELQLFFRVLFDYDGDVLVEKVEQWLCFGLSDTWRNTQKTAYLYDSDGRLTEQVHSYWDVDHWEANIQGFKRIFSYDEADNLVLEEDFYTMPTGAYSWTSISQDSIVYTSAGNNVQLFQSSWGSQQEEWMVDIQVDSLFNAEGQVMEIIRQLACSDTLVKINKETFAYTNDNKLIDWVNYYWNVLDQSWDESQKTNYTHNTSGLLDIETEQYWNEDLTVWEDRFRRLYFYDNLSLLTERILEKYEDEEWKNEGQTLFVYDSLSQLIEETISWWPSWSMEWESYLQFTYTYDENEYLIEEISSGRTCIGQNCFWDPYEQRTYSYNDQGQQIQSELFWKDYNTNDWMPFQRMTTSYDPITAKAVERLIEEYRQTNFTWEEGITYQHFWNELISSNLDMEQSELECRMANPYQTGDLIFCEDWPLDETGKIYVFDMLGRLRLEQKFSHYIRLQQELEAGTYLMLIKGESGEMFNRKIIMQ